MTKHNCAGALATGSPTSALDNMADMGDATKEAGHVETTAV